MIRVVQSLEKIAEQQRVLEARLIAIDRRLDNMQQFQQQPQPNDPVTEIPGLPIKTLDELVAFEEHIKINEKYFEFVSIIFYCIVWKGYFTLIF
jgi:small-conductance mechanosensitive channel